MRSEVKKWFDEKGYGFISNGNSHDIKVYKSELKNCAFLLPGKTVEFECHIEGLGLVAKNVKLVHELKKQSSSGTFQNASMRRIFSEGNK